MQDTEVKVWVIETRRGKFMNVYENDITLALRKGKIIYSDIDSVVGCHPIE